MIGAARVRRDSPVNGSLEFYTNKSYRFQPSSGEVGPSRAPHAFVAQGLFPAHIVHGEYQEALGRETVQ